MSDEFGDRMKLYEKPYAGVKFMPLLPICVRLDGRSFSKWTKGLERPYDKDMSTIMETTTSYLVRETNAVHGYTQSDEISLLFYSDNIDSQVFFNAKIQKMVSILAAMTSTKFNVLADALLPGKPSALFDCRAWQVPNKMEAANVILWREMDATKNSISMAASHYYSHKELHKKNGKEMIEMLFQKGVKWNDYPAFFKRGVHVHRSLVYGKVPAEDIDSLPKKHKARTSPDMEFTRRVVSIKKYKPFSKVTNRVQVLFDDAEPEYAA